MLEIWQRCRAGSLAIATGGPGGALEARGHVPAPLLPFRGGVAEQPACTMAALAIMEAAYLALKPKSA